MDAFKIGDCVRLEERPTWLSKYMPLAQHKRPATIVSFPNDRQVELLFDTVRPGAKQISMITSRKYILPHTRKTHEPEQIGLLV